MWSDSAKLSVLQEHLTKDFDYLTQKTLRYWPEGREGPSVKLLREGKEMRKEYFKKCIILDFDGVFNRPGTPAPFQLYLGHLMGNLPYLREKKESVVYDIQMLEKGEEVESHANRLSKNFREAGLTRGIHLSAAYEASKEFSLSTNLNSAMSRLRDMAYEPFVLSASPKELVNFACDRVPINAENSEATKFYFNNDGMFERMELNLGETRSLKRDEIMDKMVSTKYGIEIMINDNPDTGRKMVKSGWNHIHFWLNEMPPMPGNINIEMLYLRNDFSKIVEKIKKLERGLATTTLMDESKYRECIHTAHEAVRYGEICTDVHGLEFSQAKSKFVRKLREYSRKMGMISNPDKIEMGVRVRGIETDPNERTSRGKIKSLVKDFYKVSLEAKLPKDLI